MRAAETIAQFELPATLDGFTALTRWLQALCADLQLGSSMCHRLDMCLCELVTNVIDYGYRDGRSGAISVRCCREPAGIVLRIEDDGAAFDPTGYVPAALPASLAEASIGGRGIRLVRHYADEMRYRRDAGTNQVTLLFRLPADERPQKRL